LPRSAPHWSEAESKIAAEKERLGIEAADDRVTVALDAHQEAVNAVYRTVPQTRDGALALIDVFREDKDLAIGAEAAAVLGSMAAYLKTVAAVA
jgi:hypothetical protein